MTLGSWKSLPMDPCSSLTGKSKGEWANDNVLLWGRPVAPIPLPPSSTSKLTEPKLVAPNDDPSISTVSRDDVFPGAISRLSDVFWDLKLHSSCNKGPTYVKATKLKKNFDQELYKICVSPTRKFIRINLNLSLLRIFCTFVHLEQRWYMVAPRTFKKMDGQQTDSNYSKLQTNL